MNTSLAQATQFAGKTSALKKRFSTRLTPYESDIGFKCSTNRHGTARAKQRTPDLS